MNEQSPIERAVMRRIHLIRVLGLIISTGALAILTIVFALWGIGKEVWVERVFQNAPTDFVRLPDFFIAAFGNTRLVVQILAILSFVSFIYLVRMTTRLIVSTFVPSRG
ncbi:MAG TPA: hypothetical protein VJI70_00905 [Candidatus Paceibacterota bacterium]